MDDGESSALKSRKRTESNGGSSDSELSEGWNVIDQTDINGPDVPSSDGESVEVIDAEDESRENATDTEAEGTVVEGEHQLSPVAKTPVVPAVESETPAIPADPPTSSPEEMFDSSFRWFLFFATAAVLVSNLAFMVADNAWNGDINLEAPSFLRDLPTTPNSQEGNNFLKNIPWAENEEVMVETLDDGIVNKDSNNAFAKRLENNLANKKKRYNNPTNEKQQEHYLKIYNREIGSYFKALSEVTSSSETHDKLDQALLVLDALYIGLNDLEDVVTANSELYHVLKKQKYKLSEVLTEVEYGVAKSMERLAINILNKVQKLERRFENQWCDLERRGHSEELKGLFYDCEVNEEKAHSKRPEDFEQKKKNIEQSDVTGKYDSKKDLNWNNYQYQVDRDSPGKEHTKTTANEASESNSYYHLVNSGKHNSEKYRENHINTKYNKGFEEKDKFYSEKNDKRKYSNNDKKHFDEKKKFTEDKRKYSNKMDTYKVYKSEEEGHNRDKRENNEGQTKNEKPPVRDSELELISKYLRENCDKNKLSNKFTKLTNMYEKLKSYIDTKLRVPKRMFDSLFARYCRVNDDSFKWEKRFNKEHRKGDFSGKSDKNFFKDDLIIEDNNQHKHVRVVDVTEVNNAEGEASESLNDDVIIPNRKPRQWIFSYDEPAHDNKSNLTGDWFFKAGDARSKVRWSHHRGDWWFERASHRRNHPQSTSPKWFSGRRKNWFFRRAWARQHCRESPHDSWCHLSDDETITLPNPSPNFR